MIADVSTSAKSTQAPCPGSAPGAAMRPQSIGDSIQTAGVDRYRSTKDENPVGREFEQLLLKNAVEAMLPKDDKLYGGGTGASIWRSMLADGIARELALRGQLGLSQHVPSTEIAKPSQVVT